MQVVHWQKHRASVHTTTKMIKLSLNDNDFKIAHLSDFFFQSDDNDKFLTNHRAYTSYRIVIVV
jgi:hypothetical protein